MSCSFVRKWYCRNRRKAKKLTYILYTLTSSFSSPSISLKGLLADRAALFLLHTYRKGGGKLARKKLTVKQQKFADEYIISGNATDAAIKAGYSKRTARSIGQENLTKPDIKKYIDDRLEEIASEKIATQTEVLEHLTKVMRREELEHQVVVLKKRKEEWLPDEEGTMRKQTAEYEEAEVVPMPTKVSDTNKAAELIGKRYALWTDKVDQTNRNIEIVVGDWDDDDED